MLLIAVQSRTSGAHYERGLVMGFAAYRTAYRTHLATFLASSASLRVPSRDEQSPRVAVRHGECICGLLLALLMIAPSANGAGDPIFDEAAARSIATEHLTAHRPGPWHLLHVLPYYDPNGQVCAYAFLFRRDSCAVTSYEQLLTHIDKQLNVLAKHRAELSALGRNTHFESSERIRSRISLRSQTKAAERELHLEDNVATTVVTLDAHGRTHMHNLRGIPPALIEQYEHASQFRSEHPDSTVEPGRIYYNSDLDMSFDFAARDPWNDGRAEPSSRIRVARVQRAYSCDNCEFFLVDEDYAYIDGAHGLATDKDTPLGDRIPVVLVHGDGSDGKPLSLNYWGWWCKAFNEGSNQHTYKVYRFVYDTDLGIDGNASCLADVLSCAEFSDPSTARRAILVAHSMGGLVTRHAVNTNPQFRSRLHRVITLNTPHLGSPAANPTWVFMDFDSLFECTARFAEVVLRCFGYNVPLTEALDFLLFGLYGWNFEGMDGDHDLAWYNPDDVPDVTPEAMLWAAGFGYDLDDITEALNFPFTGSPELSDTSWDNLFITYGGYITGGQVDGQGTYTSGALKEELYVQLFGLNVMSHHRGLWIAGEMLEWLCNDGYSFCYCGDSVDDWDGFVPIASAVPAASHPAMEHHDLTGASPYWPVDHASLLDNENMIDHIIARVNGLADSLPHVVSVSAETGGPNTNIFIAFDSAMDPSYFHSGTITVTGSTSGTHPCSFTYDAPTRTVTANPDTDFDFGEYVTVTVSAFVRDAEGETSASPHTSSFPIGDGGHFIINAHAGLHGEIRHEGELIPNGIILVPLCGDITLTATPDSGYEVDTWQVDWVPVQFGGTTLAIGCIEEDRIVYVTFKSQVPASPITVESPNGGEVYCRGDRLRVNWESMAGCGDVRLELCRNGSPVLTIADSAYNDGWLSWDIPHAQALADDYRVCATCLESGTSDCTDGTFEIAECEPPPIIYVYDVYDLQAIGSDGLHPPDGHYVLANDIDAYDTDVWNNGRGFEPIGDGYGNDFRGILDGQGHKVHRLTINWVDRDEVGLFGALMNNAVIRNLILEEVYIAGRGSVGALAGRGGGLITNCHLRGECEIRGAEENVGANTGGLVGELNAGVVASSTVSGSVWINGDGRNVGGIVGELTRGLILWCSVEIPDRTISCADSNVGGIAGRSGDEVRQCCVNSWLIDGDNYCGGLIGRNDPGGSVVDSFAIVGIDANDNAGGIIGSCGGGSAHRCYAHAGVGGGGACRGALVGRYPGNVHDSFWNNEATGLPCAQCDGSCSECFGVTTTEMRQQATFTSTYGVHWSFEGAWWIDDGATYPQLCGVGPALPAVQNLMVTSGAPSGVSLVWDPVSWDPVSYDRSCGPYYRAYRASSVDGVRVAASSWQAGTSFTDDTAVPELTYYYWVNASATTYDYADPHDVYEDPYEPGSNVIAARAGEFSNQAAGWRAFPPLTAPTDVAATDRLPNETLVTWSAVRGASFYRVYRASSLGEPKEAVGLWLTEPPAVDSSGVPDTTYYYWVTAAADDGGTRESDFGGPDTGSYYVPDTTAPAVTLSWSPSEPLEDEQVTVNVIASDNVGLDVVSALWFDGDSHSVSWSEIGSPTFEEDIVLGPFPPGQILTCQATAWDTSGNQTQAGPFTFTILADTDDDGIPDVEDNCPQHANADQADGDGDGRGDACDSCPSDSNKIDPGVCGCGTRDVDSDSDGVFDCDDLCPDTPDGESVDLNGCLCSQRDDDGDGVNDCDDECGDTPPAESVDPNGCSCSQLDDDGDGVNNCDDNCPQTDNSDQANRDGDDAGDTCDDCPDDPNKASPGVCGCGVAETDSDDDGTPDCIDGCSDDPHKTEPGDCGCGNVDADADDDGVVDCKDDCPNTPTGQVVDPSGCPIDLDSDGDGDPDDTDCQALDPAVYHGATEVCNGIDDDCDGLIDEGILGTTWYRDADGDGFGVANDRLIRCAKPPGYATRAGDCDDSDPDINPGELDCASAPDGLDNNCNGAIDDGRSCPCDADDDGVCDGEDACPNTWGTCPNGCPPTGNGVCPGVACGLVTLTLAFVAGSRRAYGRRRRGAVAQE